MGTVKKRIEIEIEIKSGIEIRKSTEIKKKKEKGNAKKRKKSERKWNMPERRRKWKILVTVKTVMIQVMVKMKSSVYLMSLFLMKIIRYISQCMIRLKHEDLVLRLEKKRKLGDRKKLSTSLLNLKLSGQREKKRKNL